jgi:hypothetical protein
MPLKLKKGERLVVTDGAYQGYKGWYNDHPDNTLVQSHKAHVILEVPDGNGLTVCKLIHRNKTRLENAPPPRTLPRAIFYEHNDVEQKWRAAIRATLECGQLDFNTEMMAAIVDLYQDESAVYLAKGSKAKHRKMKYKKEKEGASRSSSRSSTSKRQLEDINAMVHC